MLRTINATNVAAHAGPRLEKALDLAVSADGKYLYSNGTGTTGRRYLDNRAERPGALTAQTFVMLPSSDATAGFNGIAGFFVAPYNYGRDIFPF